MLVGAPCVCFLVLSVLILPDLVLCYSNYFFFYYPFVCMEKTGLEVGLGRSV